MKILVLSIIFFITACGAKNATGSGVGFEGVITIELTMDGDNISDIILVEAKDTPCLLDRAFPILKERIIVANTPLVDSVSGASYSSFGIKTAVSKALTSIGKKAPKININSKAQEKPDTIIDNVTTDLVIIGGGPAGIAAVLTAYENGISNIILVEKLDILSGNGKFDKNFYDLVNSEGQRKLGIEDSADKFYDDMIKRYKGDNTNKLRVLADYSATTDEWIRKYGAMLDYVNTNVINPSSPRSHQVSEEVYAGDYLQRALETGLSNTTVDIRTGTQGLDLIVDGSTVTGVRVKNNNNESYTIYAKAVVIATGGFSANAKLIAKYNKEFSKFVTSNQDKNTGDFIPVFEKNNIALKNLDVINFFPHTIVKNRALTGSDEFGVDFILVNKNGYRFVKEKGASRVEYAKVILQQPDQMAYYIFDEASRVAGPRIRIHIKKGYGVQGKNLNELATKIKIDYSVLSNTISDYNKIIKGEIEDPFGRTPYTREFASKGPFYAIAVRPALHMTRGGVVVNAKGEVQSTSGQSIKGLYAAGEVTDIQDGAYMAAVALGRATADNVSSFLKNN